MRLPIFFAEKASFSRTGGTCGFSSPPNRNDILSASSKNGMAAAKSSWRKYNDPISTYDCAISSESSSAAEAGMVLVVNEDC